MQDSIIALHKNQRNDDQAFGINETHELEEEPGERKSCSACLSKRKKEVGQFLNLLACQEHYSAPMYLFSHHYGAVSRVFIQVQPLRQ